MLFRSLVLIFIAFSINISYGNDLFDEGLQKRLKAFENLCKSKEVKKIYEDKERPNRLLLIDATDPLNEAQIQYLKDNYIKGVNWQDEGEKFSIVVLNSKPISELDRITMCSPKPEDKIGWFDAKNKAQKLIKLYQQTLEEAFDIMVRSSKEADSTRLVETLYQIYTNKRFDFLEGDRKLLIASDLLQKSTEINLYCKGSCPTFQQTYNTKKQWFDLTKLQLRDSDVVEIYYLQAKCRVNFATLTWWQDYFLKEGVKPENIFALAENNNTNQFCTGTVKEHKAIGESGTPGPIIGNKPRNGISGFTSVR